jgi:DNA-binding CsgD family transcriptional regulator
VKVMRRTAAATHTIGHPKPSASNSVYLFCEKSSGAAHFHVQAGPHGELPLDHAAGLLAMHCMVRGQAPADYMIMVPASQDTFNGLAERAQKLLEAGHSAKNGVKLTRREEEVLEGVLRSLANKEIANELHLSERTVKFHVSSLLAKYKVRSRMELVRETANNSMKSMPLAVGSLAVEVGPFGSSSDLFQAQANSRKVVPLPRPRLMA